MSARPEIGPERLSPAIALPDPGAACWVGQAVLRLRRETAWLRRDGAADPDPLQAAFDLLRHDRARRAFFEADPAARWLTERIEAAPPRDEGAFGRMADAAGLSAAERFVLGLALAARIDGAIGPALAFCQSDPARPFATLALAQTLWDDPLAVLEAQDPTRPLAAYGLLAEPPRTLADSLVPCPGLARWLSGTTEPAAFGLARIAPDPAVPAPAALAARFAAPPASLEIAPLTGPAQADARGFLAALAAHGARPCLAAGAGLGQALPIAWLSGTDLLLDAPISTREDAAETARRLDGAARMPVRVFLRLTERDLAGALPPALLGPMVSLPATPPARRAELLRAALGPRTRRCAAGVDRAAREFRLEPVEIARIAAGLTMRAAPPDEAALIAACRAECDIDFHGLAEPLEPRFALSEVILPPAAGRQFAEAAAAIRGAGRVQHDWGGEQAFGEAGIALLFAGPPGAGKTMAAQALARDLDLPIYRVDLSQIVNKYIGETEKNLKRVFDAAEKFRCILFFDEAEALFGKRTEAKDANDRFANVETGYLLQRMESFTGVAILATNRRKDLDEAFSRRLRYVIEFPIPGEAERRRIWACVFPPGADLSALDFDFLARRFQLSGGHIRSIAFNASLQCAARADGRRIEMRDALIATRRELDKLNRTSGADAFGDWFHQIEELRG